jgi:hypothetical protein
MEWNYGEYEGLTSREIREQAPGWLLFNDGFQAARLLSRWMTVPIVSSHERVVSKEMSCSSRMGTCCAFWRRAG